MTYWYYLRTHWLTDIILEHTDLLILSQNTLTYWYYLILHWLTDIISEHTDLLILSQNTLTYWYYLRTHWLIDIISEHTNLLILSQNTLTYWYYLRTNWLTDWSMEGKSIPGSFSLHPDLINLELSVKLLMNHDWSRHSLTKKWESHCWEWNHIFGHKTKNILKQGSRNLSPMLPAVK